MVNDFPPTIKENPSTKIQTLHWVLETAELPPRDRSSNSSCSLGMDSAKDCQTLISREEVPV